MRAEALIHALLGLAVLVAAAAVQSGAAVAVGVAAFPAYAGFVTFAVVGVRGVRHVGGDQPGARHRR